jgi:hypothetical protein
MIEYDSTNETYYNILTFISTENDIKKMFSKFQKKYILSNEWLLKNIMQLCFDKDKSEYKKNIPTPTSITIPYGGIDVSSTTNSPLEKLQDKIKNNSDTRKIDILYTYLNRLKHIASNFKRNMDNPNATNNIELTGTGNNIFEKLEPDNITPSIIKRPLYSTEIYKEKLAHNDNNIYFNKYEVTSEMIRLFEDEVRMFNRSFWLDQSDIDLTNFIDNLSDVNRVKLYYKFIYIYTLLNSTRKNNKIQLDLATPKFTIDDKDLSNQVGRRPAIYFFNMINNNETLNKLFRIARHLMVQGLLQLDVPNIYLENGILDISSHYIKNIGDTSGSITDEFTDSATYKNINLIGSLSLLNGIGLLLKLVDDKKIGIASGSDEESAYDNFKSIIDEMYNERSIASDSINIIRTFDLVY